MSDDTSLSRRQSLALIVKLMVFVAILAFIWVILASLTFNQQSIKEVPGHYINIDVSSLEAGKLRNVSSRHKEIWIYRRSESDIQQLKQAGDSLRSVVDEYFVFVPYEPLRNCQVQWNEHDRTFHDPCSGNQFDLAGRIVKGKHKNQDIYLPIPEYLYTPPGQLNIDARLASIR